MRSPATTSALFNTVKTARLGWQRNSIDHGRHCLRVGYRFASSNSSDPQDSTENASTTAHPSSLESQSIQTAPVPTPAVERPERGRRAKTASAPPIESVDWPEDLEVLSTGPYDSEPDPSDASALPPPHIFDEVLNNFLITLHPQTQNRATYATAQGPAVEPTLALYCPIEGGDYIIDATVKELARRTGAELLVIDGVQLAAGEWGEFGKAANMIRLPSNPLHFRASSVASPPPMNMMDDDDDGPHDGPFPNSMIMTVMSPLSSRGTVVTTAKAPTAAPSKAKIFFDALVNMPSSDGVKSPPPPRIVYIRDFPTLAPSSSTWYRPLLNAVRQRRRGPIASPSSPITNPMTIIFGICPSITPPELIAPPAPGGTNLLSLLMGQRGAEPSTSASKPSKTDWNEDESATKARESRLRRRLKKWEKGDMSLLDEFPVLTLEDGEESDSKRSGSGEMVMLGGKAIPLPFMSGSVHTGSRSHEAENKSPFFRTSILVPSSRSLTEEHESRVDRRREINELTTRMAVGAVGGVLDQTSIATLVEEHAEEKEVDDAASNPAEAVEPPAEKKLAAHEQMWEEWGKRVDLWMDVREVADRAVGSVVADMFHTSKKSLDPTPVPWDALSQAWLAAKSSKDLRKSWMKDAMSVDKNEKSEADKQSTGEALPSVDELVERLKNDPDLDAHEQRLLPSIVNPATMPTSFGQVHLPTNTIDSVRTIVSLPLLHPEAFQQGILKEHSITGCLLFGPPGTGKTLVVRALAKEAGCRMMSISPSDVMDMYVGEGEKLVKAVFTLARKLSPCVVFLDEIDALLGARSTARESGSSIAHRGVITEFMQEMDGLKTNKESTVIVIGATNRPFDLDDAVLRRLPRRLLVDLPGEKEREEILKIMLRNEQLDTDVDIKTLAKRTESFSGSDLKHLAVSAAVDAVKDHVQLPWLVANKESSAQETTGEAPAQMEEVLVDLPPPQIKEEIQSEPSVTPAVGDQDAEGRTETLTPTEPIEADAKPLPTIPRVLSHRHFEKALKEITPSSSEAIGTLSALRKWNEEFGEGRRDRKRKQIWGKGRFGFSDPANMAEEDGRVLPTPSKASGADDGSPPP